MYVYLCVCESAFCCWDQSTRGKVCFGSQVQRFQSTVNRLCCFGPEVSQNMTEGHGKGKPPSSWHLGSRESERGTRHKTILLNPSDPLPSTRFYLPQFLLLPVIHSTINGFIHCGLILGRGQCPHGPITSPKPHL